METHVVKSEVLDFEVSSTIMRYVIENQAGSIEKAILETVMNAVDAKADNVPVRFEGPSKLAIEDDGHGLRTREEVRKHFGVFGFDHQTDDEQAYGRQLGKFGIGRGQIFAFAATRWLTNQFEMEVDIRNKALVFKLTEHDDKLVQGCTIVADMYDPMTRMATAAAINLIKKQTRYAPVNAFVNGERGQRRRRARVDDRPTCGTRRGADRVRREARASAPPRRRSEQRERPTLPQLPCASSRKKRRARSGSRQQYCCLDFFSPARLQYVVDNSRGGKPPSETTVRAGCNRIGQ